MHKLKQPPIKFDVAKLPVHFLNTLENVNFLYLRFIIRKHTIMVTQKANKKYLVSGILPVE